MREAVDAAIELLDSGRARVAEPVADGGNLTTWRVNEWLKKAVLLSFRLYPNDVMAGGPSEGGWWDKVSVEIRRLGRAGI